MINGSCTGGVQELTGSYLNSILQASDKFFWASQDLLAAGCWSRLIEQYLYSIKPLRDAVIDFEQNEPVTAAPVKPDVERSKRCEPPRPPFVMRRP